MTWSDGPTIWISIIAFNFLSHCLVNGVDPLVTTFDKIEGQNVLTKDGRNLPITGTMHMVRSAPLHEAVFKDGGAVTFPVYPNPCWSNLDRCTDGFTLIIEMKLTILYDDDLVIASSGADRSDSQGMLLTYNRRKWGFKALVRTSTLNWIVDVPYHLMPKKWHDIVFSWSPQNGIVVLIDGFTAAMQRTKSTIKTVTNINRLCLGCSYRQRKFTSNFSVRKVTQADNFYKELIKAKILGPEKAQPERSETMVDFQAIDGREITGTYVRMDYSGTVELEDSDEGKILVMESPGAFVNLGKIGHPCLDDIETCTSGFTIRITFTLTSNTKDRQVIFSSGTESQTVRGMSVHYKDKVISVFVKTSKQAWMTEFSSALNPGIWHTLDVTWSSDFGIELHLDNKFITGTAKLTKHAAAPPSKRFLLGKAPNDATTTRMRVFEILLWKSMYERLNKVDMQLPRLKNVKVTTTTATTTILTTNTTPKSTTTPIVKCPDFKSSLTLQVQAFANGNTKFYCTLAKVPANDLEVQMVFKIQREASSWFKVIGNPDKRAVLTVAEMKQQIYDKKIYCEARARFFRRGAQYCSELIVSNTLHVAVKIETLPDQIVIWEGQPSYNVAISSTVPPSALCRPEDRGNCRVEIITTLSTASNELKCPYKEIIPQAVLGVGLVGQGPRVCGVLLTKQNWRKPIQIPIKATLDGKLDGNQERNLRVDLKISSLVSDYESVIELQKIKVKIIENDKNKICSSYNDPHLKSFDAKAYDMHIPGEFVLYKHRQLEYEVRALYQKCSGNGGPSCNRGAAVRSGDDVISFTTGQKKGVSVQMYINGDLTPGTKIYCHGSGSQYDVHLPHGTVVTVKYTNGLWINIFIKPSSTDIRQTEGLCGMFNGRTDDDFDFADSIKTFAMKWKRTDSMFKGVPAQKQKKALVYCSCQENQAPRCEPNLDAFHCLANPSSIVDITNVLVQQAQQSHIKKRQNGSRVKRATPDDNNVENTHAAVVSEKWTSESAREYCESFLESAEQVQMCNKYLDMNDTQLGVTNCAADLVALQEKKWAVSHLERLIDSCFTTVTRDVEKWTKNSDGTMGPPSDMVDGLCPVPCGDHGKCQYGACNCDDGWTGEGCDLGVDSTPEVFPAKEACDLLTSSCHVVGVDGDKFVPTSNLACVFQFVEIDGSKVTNVGQPETVDAIYMSQYKVICKQPDTEDQARSCLVAISNNGGRTTSVDRHLHVVHTSSCQACDMSDDGRGVSCVKVAEACEIDGQCYAKYERYEGDACYRCDPGKRKDAWTLTSEPTCSKYEDSDHKISDKVAIVFIVLFVLLVIALIVMIVVVIKLKRSGSNKSSIKFDKTDNVTLQSVE